MDDQPSRVFYYTGMLALLFLVAYLLSATVFDEEARKSSGTKEKVARKTPDKKDSNEKESPSNNPDSIQEAEKTEQSSTFDFEEKPVAAVAPMTPLSFEKSLQSRADSIRALLATGLRRTDVILRYYPHLPDGKIVYSLSDLGFYLHERPTDVNQLEKATNSLFYGDNVPLADIQLVAYELVKRGAKIRQIKMSRFHDDWKSNSIEIGAESSAENLPILRLEDIQAFKKAN